MKFIFLFFYKIAIQVYYLGIKIAALSQPKARLWLKGRKSIFEKLAIAFEEEKNPLIWFHCASLGEFEQGRPVIETLKKDYPSYKILLTFFSPSGYEVRENYVQADYIFYLPLDTKKNAAKFIAITRPKLAVFVKYEFWYFYLKTLKKCAIPTILIAGIFRKNHWLFKWYGQWHLDLVKNFSHLFLQDKNSLEFIDNQLFKNTYIVGDPRIDRVLFLAKNAKKFPLIEQFKGTNLLLIAGSTHAKDELILSDLLLRLPAKWKCLIVPHEATESHLKKTEKRLPIPSIRYSKIEHSGEWENCKILLIDTVGMLNALYQYGDLVYIGGGFGSGIHNILEPAVFGLPIIFGPNYQKFEEAKFLIEQKGAFSIQKTVDLIPLFQQMNNQVTRVKAGKICQQYLQKNKGATEKIVKHLRMMDWH